MRSVVVASSKISPRTVTVLIFNSSDSLRKKRPLAEISCELSLHLFLSTVTVTRTKRLLAEMSLLL